MEHTDLIDQLISITGCPDTVAQHVLEAHNWDLEASINFYIESGGIGHGNSFGVADESDQGFEAPQLRPQPASNADVDIVDLNQPTQVISIYSKRLHLLYIHHGFLASDETTPLDAKGSPYPHFQIKHNKQDNTTNAPIVIDDNDDNEVQIVKETAGPSTTRRQQPPPLLDDDDMEIVEEIPPPRRKTRTTTNRRRNIDPPFHPELEYHQADDDDELMAMIRRQQQQRHLEHRIRDEDLLNDNSTEEEAALPILPDDVDLEEQRMLMAALTGSTYEGRIPDFQTDPRYRPRNLSPTTMSRQNLRDEQDAAYYESLAADMEKAAAAERIQREQEEKERALREQQEAEQQAERERVAAYERLMQEKAEALPAEPAADDVDAVTLVIRLPDGKRLTRRFRKMDPFAAVFGFVDVENKGNDSLRPGSYNLVSSYPRRVFEDGSGGTKTLADLDLAHKQEALFIEMK